MWWETTLRLAALVAVTTATGVATLAWFRARKLRASSAPLWRVAFLGWMAVLLRVLTTLAGEGLVAFPRIVLSVAANSYFVVLGVTLILLTTELFVKAEAVHLMKEMARTKEN